jgi:hypothetical protein
MNAEVYQEKMDKLHRGYLCQMLGVKFLPVEVLQHYKKVKMLIDRIDGHLTPGDMAMIIISAENSPEVAGELADDAIEEAAKNMAEQPSVGQVLNAFEDIKVENTIEPQTIEGDTSWTYGMPVRVLDGEEIKEGKIAGISNPSEVAKKVGAKVQLTVEFEGGETETYDEDEVEAV